MYPAMRVLPILGKQLSLGSFRLNLRASGQIRRHLASSANFTATSPPTGVLASLWANERVAGWMQKYEDFLGLTEVKDAQANVMEAERKFIHSQQVRRERNRQVGEIQLKLQEIRTELERTARGEDRYLALVTQEHKLVKEERALQLQAGDAETSERSAFSLLSAAVRDSHEKERARAERTKYWSVIGSVFGAIIGILGTSLNNWLKMKELQSLVTKSVATNSLPVENLALELSSLSKTQQQQLETFVNDLKNLLGEQKTAQLGEQKTVERTKNDKNFTQKTTVGQYPSNAQKMTDNQYLSNAQKMTDNQYLSNEQKTTDSQYLSNAQKMTDNQYSSKADSQYTSKEIVNAVKEHQLFLVKEMQSIKEFIAAKKGLNSEDGEAFQSVVYVRDDLEKALDRTEWKMKINSIVTAAFMYTAFALTIPLLYYLYGQK